MTAPAYRKTLPPFIRQMDPKLYRREVMLLTGSAAFERARSRTWFPGQKVALPLGADLDAFEWPFQGRTILLFSFGLPEPRDRLHRLSILLVQSGAALVLWCCGESPAPVYRPRMRPA